jgi:hypothetical protein
MSYRRDFLDFISPISSCTSSESINENKKQRQQTFDQESYYKLEQAILQAAQPLDIKTTDVFNFNGQNYQWCNKYETDSFNDYEINKDNKPNLIAKQNKAEIEYEQEIIVRYLRPPTPPTPGDIILKQERNLAATPPPPIVLRQQPERPETPQPLIIRETPPKQPPDIRPKFITLPSKKLPPQPRRVVIERMPPIPAKPQKIIIERWLPYKERKRRVILIKEFENESKPHNTIIQWEPPKVTHKKIFKDMGIIKTDPIEYVKKYKNSLLTFEKLPDFVKNIEPPKGVKLAAQCTYPDVPLLEGDIDALKQIDLDEYGLSEYKYYLKANLLY